MSEYLNISEHCFLANICVCIEKQPVSSILPKDILGQTGADVGIKPVETVEQTERKLNPDPDLQQALGTHIITWSTPSVACPGTHIRPPPS